MADRKRSNAEIDALNMFLAAGETPLPYEIEDTNEDSNSENNQHDNPQENEEVELTEEQKTENARIKAEADAAQKIIDDAAAEEEKKKLNAPAEIELDDEKVLAYIKNKSGKDVTSFEELLNPKKELTEAEKQEAAEKREANKFAFGLSQGLFTKKQLDEFTTDINNKKDLVFNIFAATQKANDETLTDEEIEEEFEEKFGLNQKEDSRQYKAGQTLLENIADNIIRKKHAKVLNLENDFTSYETTQSQQKESEQKILTQAPIYKKDIEGIRSEIKKVSIPISDTETFETELDDEVVNSVINRMLDPKYAETQIKNGWSREKAKEVASTSAIIENLGSIIKKYGEKIALEKQAGVRGIVPKGKEGKRDELEVKLTEDQKKALNFAFPATEQIAN